MATNIFLGKPPKYIEDWYKSHSTKRETIVTYKGGEETQQTVQVLIEGQLTSSSIPNRTNVTKVEIGSAVTSIGQNALADCINLTSVTIPDSVTNIEQFAFYNCNVLTSVTIPDGVTSIGNYAFAYCISLTSVTIPDSVTNIGDSAFYNCTNISEIYMYRFTTQTVKENALTWGIGITATSKVMVTVFCSDGIVVVNSGSGSSSGSAGESSSGSSSGSLSESHTYVRFMPYSFGESTFGPGLHDCGEITAFNDITSTEYGMYTSDVEEIVGGTTINVSHLINSSSFNNLQQITVRGNLGSTIADGIFYGFPNLTQINLPDTWSYTISYSASSFGIGIDQSGRKYTVVVNCYDGIVVVNSGSGSSSQS